MATHSISSPVITESSTMSSPGGNTSRNNSSKRHNENQENSVKKMKSQLGSSPIKYINANILLADRSTQFMTPVVHGFQTTHKNSPVQFGYPMFVPGIPPTLATFPSPQQQQQQQIIIQHRQHSTQSPLLSQQHKHRQKQQIQQQQQQNLQMSNVPNSEDSMISPQPLLILPNNLSPYILPCSGNLIENSTQKFQYSIRKSNLFRDVFDYVLNQNSTNSNRTQIPSESLAVFIVTYLTSIANGGTLVREVLEAMLNYAKTCEQEWLQAHQKFFNSKQVGHLARLATYTSNSNVMVQPANNSLINGINQALSSLSALPRVPDFILVYNAQQSKHVEFCVIALNSAICKQIEEYDDLSISSIDEKLRDIHKIQMIPEEEKLHKILWKRQLKIKDKALPPFKTPNYTTLTQASILAKILPQSSHVVEYQPRGPFKAQEATALALLQKVKNLPSLSSESSFISNFSNVDFRIFVPPISSLYWQTFDKLIESELVKEVIGSRMTDDNLPSSSTFDNYIIKLDLTQFDNPQLSTLFTSVKQSPNTLFVCIQDNAHYFTTLEKKHLENFSGQDHVVVSSACLKYFELLNLPNVISIAVSSNPVSLLTQCSSIPPENEVSWVESTDVTQGAFGYPKGGHFKDLDSMLDDCSNVKIYEDSAFEDLVESMCEHPHFEKSCLEVIRARLLLQDYTAALLKLTGEAKSHSCTSETFSMLHDLVQYPMNNTYGYGPMIVIRSHTKEIGKHVYNKLVETRKVLGLHYRFEIIFDDGSEDLVIDPYFVKRMRTWKFGKNSTQECNGVQFNYFTSLSAYKSSWKPRTFLQLNNLPCILIIAGKNRGGETLPKSVSHYDLRLVSGTRITKQMLDADLGYLHHYTSTPSKNNTVNHRQTPSSNTDSPPITDTHSPTTQNMSTIQNYEDMATSLSDIKTENVSPFNSPEGNFIHSKYCNLAQSSMEEYKILSGDINRFSSPIKSPHSQRSDNSSNGSLSNKSNDFSIERLTAQPTTAVVTCVSNNIENDNLREDTLQESIMEGTSSGRESVVSNFSDPDISGLSGVYRSAFEFTNSNNSNNISGNILQTAENMLSLPTTKFSHTATIHYHGNNGISHTSKMNNTKASYSNTINSAKLFNSNDSMQISSTTLPTSLEDFSDSDDECEDEIGITDYFQVLHCIVPRPYKCVLTSKFATLNIRELLAPASNLIIERNTENMACFNSKEHSKLSKFYRKHSKPCVNHIDSVRLSPEIKNYLLSTNDQIHSRFLLTGPPQVGKTASYLLFIKLLQNLVHSSNFIKVYDKIENIDQMDRPLSSDLFLPSPQDVLNASFNANPSLLYQHEKVSPLIYFENMSSNRNENNTTNSNLITHSEADEDYNVPSAINVKGENRGLISSEEPSSRDFTPNRQIFNDFSFSPLNHYNTKKDCFSVIQQLPDLAFAYDKSHSCAKCIKHYGKPTQQSHELTYYMKKTLNTKLVFYIPDKQLDSFIISDLNMILSLKLPFYKQDAEAINFDNFHCRTPIFTPSTGRASTGLLNLAHAMKHNSYNHIVVVNQSEVAEYKKYWQSHIIMALPDSPEFYSLGGIMECIKEFVTECYAYHEAIITQAQEQSFIIWPYVLVLSDSCLMFKSTPAKMSPPQSGSKESITLFDMLKHIELDPEFPKYGAISVRQWTSKSIPEENYSKCFLNTGFLYLNTPMLKDVHFDNLSHTCVTADLTLKLLVFRIPFIRINRFSYIKKFIQSGGESFHNTNHDASKVSTMNLHNEPNKFIGRAYIDHSLPVIYSGSYIMEAYLRANSAKLFPLSSNKEHPVLMVNKFVNMSEKTFVSFVHEKDFDSNGVKEIEYGGLMIHSSEMIENGQFLKQFVFAKTATICIISPDRSLLKKDVGRLNLEDRWRFKLLDEFFTLCSSEKQPLYFYTGENESVRI